MSYKITHIDNSTFIGGEPNDSKWTFINKPIIKLEYKLGKRTIIFENYEAYNHVVERFQTIGSKPGQCGICRLILMVKKRNQVLKVIYNFRKGRVTQEICKFGEEYRGKPHINWKRGIMNGNSQVRII